MSYQSAPSPISVTTPDLNEGPEGCENWLLVSNCQASGLANCLNLLTDEIQVEHYNAAGFSKSIEDILRRWSTFDRVLFAPRFLHMLPDDVRESTKVWQVPPISFNAYHPDIFYLFNEGRTLKGPLGDYHSAIAYAGFKLGLSIHETAQLYNESTYSRLGYLDRWDNAKRHLLGKFEQSGFDLRMKFAAWTRKGAFMFSNNHVKISCLMDVAKAILERAGKQVIYQGGMPHDNLMNGPVFPVYPEIGARLGVQGSYLFKRGGAYRFIRLERFIDESFSAYTRAPQASPAPENSYVIERTLSILGQYK